MFLIACVSIPVQGAQYGEGAVKIFILPEIPGIAEGLRLQASQQGTHFDSFSISLTISSSGINSMSLLRASPTVSGSPLMGSPSYFFIS